MRRVQLRLHTAGQREVVVRGGEGAADGVVEAAVEDAVGVGGGDDEVELHGLRVQVGEVGVVGGGGEGGGGDVVLGDGALEGGGGGGVLAEEVDVGEDLWRLFLGHGGMR